LEQFFRLQNFKGAVNSRPVDPEVRGELSLRGQALTRRELAGQDLAAKLIGQLEIDGRFGIPVKLDFHTNLPLWLLDTVMIPKNRHERNGQSKKIRPSNLLIGSS
jgi:hypothetical protein